MATKFSLIDEVNQAWKFWSLRLTAVGTTLLAIITAFPEAMIGAWMVLPDDLKQYLPQQYLGYVTTLVFIAAMVARVLKQHNLAKEGNDDAAS